MLNRVYFFQPDFGMSIQSPPKVSARPVGLIDIEESRTSGVGETSNGKTGNLFVFCSFLCLLSIAQLYSNTGSCCCQSHICNGMSVGVTL